MISQIYVDWKTEQLGFKKSGVWDKTQSRKISAESSIMNKEIYKSAFCFGIIIPQLFF